MSETNNIQTMAEDLAIELFKHYGWEHVAPKNGRWTCKLLEKHKKQKAKVHPTDLVFRYRDPHSGKVLYLNSDVKSYKASSIETFELDKCLESLAITVECANVSSAFRNLYVDESQDFTVQGLLFIYNHAGDYTKDFSSELAALNPRKLPLSAGDRIFSISPARVRYLYTVMRDIQSEYKPDGVLFGTAPPEYQYPILATVHDEETSSRVGSIETLLAPWQVYRYLNAAGEKAYLVYTDIEGKDDKEFQYLLGCLFHYQFAAENTAISIRMPNAAPEAEPCFARAKKQYAREYWPSLKGVPDEKLNKSTIHKHLENIKIMRVPASVPNFSEPGQGMK